MWRARSGKIGPSWSLSVDVQAADLLQDYEAKIVALERMVGRQALEIEFLKGALKSAPRPRSASTIRLHRPYRISVAEGCRLMGLPRSTYYDAPPVKTDDDAELAPSCAIAA